MAHEVLDHLADALAVVKDTGELIYANAPMLKLAACSSQSLLSRNLRQILTTVPDAGIDELLADIAVHRGLRREITLRTAERNTQFAR